MPTPEETAADLAIGAAAYPDKSGGDEYIDAVGKAVSLSPEHRQAAKDLSDKLRGGGASVVVAVGAGLAITAAAAMSGDQPNSADLALASSPATVTQDERVQQSPIESREPQPPGPTNTGLRSAPGQTWKIPTPVVRDAKTRKM